MRDDQIALQLYTVREAAASDLPGTLGAVAQAGYRAVEVAGLPPVEPARLADLLADHRLRVVAAHESLASLRTDRDAVLDRLVAIGCPRLVVPSMTEADRETPEALRATAADLATFAAAAGERGLRFAYHNHDFEFAALDGSTVWSILLDALPPEVDIELDVYWAAFAGEDAVALIRELGTRVRLLHMKDMASGPDRRDAPPGEGILPWADIVTAARTVGVEWYVVEQDHPRAAIRDVTSGYRYLVSLANDDGRPGDGPADVDTTGAGR